MDINNDILACFSLSISETDREFKIDSPTGPGNLERHTFGYWISDIQ